MCSTECTFPTFLAVHYELVNLIKNWVTIFLLFRKLCLILRTANTRMQNIGYPFMVVHNLSGTSWLNGPFNTVSIQIMLGGLFKCLDCSKYDIIFIPCKVFCVNLLSGLGMLVKNFEVSWFSDFCKKILLVHNVT